MKSVLVIDTPKTCKECPCQMMLVCVPADEDVDEYIDPSKGKPDWCPLRPLPKHKYGFEDNGLSPSDQILVQNGWNDCLDDITGEKDESSVGY